VLNVFKHDFVSDDLTIVLRTEEEKKEKPKNYFKYLWTIINGDAYWRDDIVTPRIISLTIHLSVVAMIYLAFGKNLVSAIAAFLFMINPVHTDCWVWLSGKPYSRTALASMLAFMFPLAAPVIFLIPNVICVSGIFFPLIYLFAPGSLKLLAMLSLYMLITFGRWIFDKEKNGKLKGYENNKVASQITIWKFVTALKFYGYYLANSIFGIHYCFYQSYMGDHIDSLAGIKKAKRLDLFFFIGLAAAGTLGYCLLKGIDHISVFGLAWATLNIAMWCNFVNTGQQYIANRYVYLPNIGLMLALSGIIVNYPVVIGVLAGFYAARLVPSIAQFHNVFWHFFYQVNDEPRFYFSWLNMGTIHFHRGQFQRARGDYLEALSCSPNNFKALFNLSSACIALKKLEEAMQFFEAAKNADIYGQEKKAELAIKQRMELFNELSMASDLRLRIEDIPVLS